MLERARPAIELESAGLPSAAGYVDVTRVLEGALLLSALNAPAGVSCELAAHGVPERYEGITFFIGNMGSRIGDLFVSLSVNAATQNDSNRALPASLEEERVELERELRREVTLVCGDSQEASAVKRACDLLALAVRLDEEGVPLSRSCGKLLRKSDETIAVVLQDEAALPSLDPNKRYRFTDDDTAGYMELWAERVQGRGVLKLAYQPDIEQISFAFCRRAPGMLGGGGSPRVRNALMVLASVLSRYWLDSSDRGGYID